MWLNPPIHLSTVTAPLRLGGWFPSEKSALIGAIRGQKNRSNPQMTQIPQIEMKKSALIGEICGPNPRPSVFTRG
jgi:hypothetical protein